MPADGGDGSKADIAIFGRRPTGGFHRTRKQTVGFGLRRQRRSLKDRRSVNLIPLKPADAPACWRFSTGTKMRLDVLSGIVPAVGHMGRPKEFCVEGALTKALEVFWRHGFEGASLNDLTAAMGITRPSLYATFGNKEDLFHKALELYDALYMGFARDALEEPRTFDVVDRIFAGFIEVTTASSEPRGCLGTSGALVCSTAAEPIKDELVRRRAVFEGQLRRRLEVAQDHGDLPTEECPADLARFVMIIAAGISVQAAGGASRASLERAASLALRAWPAPPDRIAPKKTITATTGA